MNATVVSPTTRLPHAMKAQLARRRRREEIRVVGLRAIAVLAWLFAALALLFPIDFLLDLSAGPRALVLVLILLALYRWGGQRFWPAPIPRSDLDWALAVESSQSDPVPLVAAWQFATAPPEGGSQQLLEAVISQTDQKSRDIDPLRGFRWRPLPRRIVVFLVVFLIALGLVSFFPDHARAFAARLALQSISYPTETAIVTISVQSGDLPSETHQVKENQAPFRFRAPQGEPVRIRVRAVGKFPAAGQLFRGDSGSDPIALNLQSSPNGERALYAEYRGQIERLDGPFAGSIQLGDAARLPIEIAPIPRPMLTVAFQVEPPGYASHNPPQPPESGALVIAVLPGSRVTLDIEAENKPLEEVTVAWSDQSSSTEGEQTTRLRQDASNPRLWRLSAEQPPWDAIDTPISYRILARDVDGLAPAKEISGEIRLRADRPPRVSAQARVRAVLPTARPTLEFTVLDDFGLAAIALEGTLSRNGEVVSQRSEPLSLPPHQVASHEQGITLNIADWNAQPGDEMSWVVEATDDRGNFSGQAGRSEPVRMTITDRATLFSGMRELDQTTAERLDAIIEQQLRIGNEE